MKLSAAIEDLVRQRREAWPISWPSPEVCRRLERELLDDIVELVAEELGASSDRSKFALKLNLASTVRVTDGGWRIEVLHDKAAEYAKDVVARRVAAGGDA